MSDAISSVLSQIRSYQSQVGQALPGGGPGAAGGVGGLGGTNAPAGVGGAAGVGAPSFGDALGNALKKVNSLQAETRDLQAAFERGDPKADLARVMVAAQASSVAFRATVEVRNRLVQAYQDVMNMPL
ncbi:flagellar hook-basal body complex protein FliE [Silanimonas sp.]|uniref:flagellar hook-basal body complex protein FliE n=1 Tax=Silanimonas sp. TaxID=1929290 RepID=UPI0022C004D2|nr:flagellar hook-basal body complex protein FliE [Silanimonas sp.]MCZ8062207.1 flagellar hook-basal body complex protein FliE [Silanimonas sp.]